MGNHKSRDHSHHEQHHNNSNHDNQRVQSRQPASPPKFAAIRDKYETYEQLQDALRAAGLESSNLIIGN